MTFSSGTPLFHKFDLECDMTWDAWSMVDAQSCLFSCVFCMLAWRSLSCAFFLFPDNDEDAEDDLDVVVLPKDLSALTSDSMNIIMVYNM